MKRIISILPMLLMLFMACSTPCAFASEASEVLDAFHAALAKGDKGAATALLAEQITIYESGYVERSRDEYAGHHLPEDIAFAKNASRKILKTSERIDGKLAMVWQETEIKARHKARDIHLFGTETSLLEKQEG